MGNFYHGAARCSGRKFCSELFTQLFERFGAYLAGLHSADPSHLGIIKKIFSSCRSWWWIDDVNFGQWWRQKWKKGQGWSRPGTGGTGVNGLTSSLRFRFKHSTRARYLETCFNHIYKALYGGAIFVLLGGRQVYLFLRRIISNFHAISFSQIII